MKQNTLLMVVAIMAVVYFLAKKKTITTTPMGLTASQAASLNPGQYI